MKDGLKNTVRENFIAKYEGVRIILQVDVILGTRFFFGMCSDV